MKRKVKWGAKDPKGGLNVLERILMFWEEERCLVVPADIWLFSFGLSCFSISTACSWVSGIVSMVMMPVAQSAQYTPLSFLFLAEPASISCSVNRFPQFSQK